MKITKKGRLPSQILWVGRCSSCKTEAEAEQGELNPQHDQRNGSWAEEKCPYCGDRMIFYPKQRNLHG